MNLPIEITGTEYDDVHKDEIWIYNSYGMDEDGNNEERGQRSLIVLTKALTYVEAKEYPEGHFIYISYDRLVKIATPDEYPEYFL